MSTEKLYQVKQGDKTIELSLNWKQATLLSLEDDSYSIDEMDIAVYNSNKEYPHDCVYIGRTTPYGNLYVIGKDGTRDEVCDLYEDYILSDENMITKIKNELKGKNLVCHCKPLRCHGDFLLKLANE